MDCKYDACLVAFSVPVEVDGSWKTKYTCYRVDPAKCRALEELVAFVGLCIDSGTVED